MKKLVAAVMFVLFGALFACVSRADAVPPTTNDWFDVSFEALTADTVIAQGDTTGITRGAGSWTAVPTTGTAVIAADADVGDGATLLSLNAPGEELTLTPAAFGSPSDIETVSVQVKADAIDELPVLDGNVQGAFTVYLDENDELSARGWTADGWKVLSSASAPVDGLTNAWVTLYVDFATAGGVRIVRYSVKPALGSLSVLSDANGDTWFTAATNATVVSSVSLSGIGSVRTINGDSLTIPGVATYNGVVYQTFEEAIAAGVADGWVNGNVVLMADAEWSPTATGTYNIDVNGHELTVNGVVYTASGTTYEVSALNYYWIGGEVGQWSSGSNWSRTSGGEAAGNVPGSADAAVFASAATVGLSGNCNIKYVRFDSDVTFTGGGALLLNAADSGTAASDAGVVSGAGAVILSNATLRAHVGYVVVTNDIVIANASTNHLMCTSGTPRLHLYGELCGGGTAYCDQSSSGTNEGGVRFYGDTSQFSGSMYLIATNQRPTNWLADAKALDNTNSTWNIETGAGREGQTFDGGGSNYSTYFPLRVSNATYKFGALNGYIPYAKSGTTGWLTGVNLKVGFLNEDCWLSGNWYRVTDSGLEWCATDATMRYAVTNTAFIVIDSGIVELNGAGVLRSGASITFAGNGATLAFAAGVDYDVSGFLSGESTSAVAVDVEDNDLTWDTQLTDGNVPNGFVKKGTGKLTLATTPTYTGTTTIEEGTLVVPQGTTIAELSCEGGKLTVPLAGAEDETTVLTISALSEGTTFESVTNAVAVVGVTMNVVADGEGGYIVKATRTPQTFTWTGAVDTDWATSGNWTVGGEVAESLPIAVDTVLFPASEQTWEVSLAADAVASNVVFESNTEITGGSFKITTVEISGTGIVAAKGLKLVSPSNEHLTIRVPLEIPAGYVLETATSTQYKHVYLYSKVTGSGEWKMNQNNTNQRAAVQFHGDLGADMSEFAGTLTVTNATSSFRDQTGIWGSIASSSNAVWNLVGYSKTGDDSSSLLKNASTTYYFGALNATNVCASGNQSNHNKNTWEIGAREDVDSVLSGNFFCNNYTNLVGDRSDTIRKVGAGSTLTFSGSRVRAYEVNAGVLKVGADVSLLTTWDGGSYAPSIAFNGGTLKLSDAVTLDVSTNIAKVASTSAVAFDDEGVDRTWNVALPGSGGLTKKGAGTLTLTAAPKYTGWTTVEEGELIVPADTVLDVCFASGTLTGARYGAVSFADGYKFTTGTDARIAASGAADVSNLVIYIADPTADDIYRVLGALGGVTGTPTLVFPENTSDELKARWTLKVGRKSVSVGTHDIGSRLILK